MTSAAPGSGTPPATAFVTASDPKSNAEGPFDLDNPAVQSRVNAFRTHLRGFFGGALSRGAKYLPSMTDILVREGLPPELAYLPLIESGYRPQAVSPAGAVGPWQFIPATGRRYGLRIDHLVDERRDPIKSTLAASQYLKDLHEMFGDWELSLAAYNSGEYRVAQILARNDDVEDFWDMRERGYLPQETSAYVPSFLAAVQIAKAPEEYGFEMPSYTPEHFETVNVEKQVSLRAAADLCGVSATELAELNPALRSGITPSGYSLRVPVGKAEPLRVGLATYVEPVHPRRIVARSSRSSRTARNVAHGGRGVVGVAQGKKSSTRVARTTPQRYRHGGKATVQTARKGKPSRQAKAVIAKPTAKRGKARVTTTEGGTAKVATAKHSKAPAAKKPAMKRIAKSPVKATKAKSEAPKKTPAQTRRTRRG